MSSGPSVVAHARVMRAIATCIHEGETIQTMVKYLRDAAKGLARNEGDLTGEALAKALREEADAAEARGSI